MFSFLDPVFNIWTVSMTLGVDVGAAFDMLRTDVRFGGVGNTDNALPETDFAELKEKWDAMTEDEQFAALDDYGAFVAANYRAICKTYPNGREAVNELVNAWREVHERLLTQSMIGPMRSPCAARPHTSSCTMPRPL